MERIKMNLQKIPGLTPFGDGPVTLQKVVPIGLGQHRQLVQLLQAITHSRFGIILILNEEVMKLGRQPFLLMFFVWNILFHGHNSYANNSPKESIIWGNVTNFLSETLPNGSTNSYPFMASVRFGIAVSGGGVVLSGRPLKLMSPTRICLESLNNLPSTRTETSDSGSTNKNQSFTNLLLVYLPPDDERLLQNIVDSNGAATPKTFSGFFGGRSLSLKPNTSWAEGLRQQKRGNMVPLFPDEPVEGIRVTDSSQFSYLNEDELIKASELDPLKYFKIEQAGLYKWTLTFRVYVIDTNSFLKPITLPPVTVDVQIK